MAKKTILIWIIGISVVAFIVFEFCGCLFHAMPHISYMKEREFVVKTVEMYPHNYAITDDTGYRYYVRHRDSEEVFDRLDSTLINKKVTISYAHWTSAFTAIVRNSRVAKLQVGDSVYFDIIIPKPDLLTYDGDK